VAGRRQLEILELQWLRQVLLQGFEDAAARSLANKNTAA